ncbi:MAG TPA: hypothetical protein PKA62_14895 [Thermoanaerobaculia bacterium]|nr:hypothetical protein [Thermoanaerobaculia bacterium]
MPRTKRAPASQSLAAHATKGPNGTPKGSGPSVAPSLEAWFGLPVDAILATLAEDGRDEDVTQLAMDATKALTNRVHASLGSPKSELASVMTDIAVRHVVSNLTSLDVIAMVQSRPGLVMEARRGVEALRARRTGR